jgi:hypothetical protein
MRFDIDRYTSLAAPLDVSDLDFDTFVDRPLDEATLRCLRYMHDVEQHTVCYLRDLLVTRAHDDPTVTTFLTMWAYEEFWHGEALGRVLHAHGEAAGRERVATTRAARPTSPLPMWVMSKVSAHVVTVAMAWGAVNEWTTQAGYLRLAERAGHPTLTELARRIARQEGRHIDFYASQAEERLAASSRAQRVTRWLLRHRWAPVGSSLMPATETAHVIRHLFAGPDGRAMVDRIDRHIERMPGLAGLHLVAGALR